MQALQPTFHVELGKRPIVFDSEKNAFFDDVCGHIVLVKRGEFSFISVRGGTGETFVYKCVAMFFDGMVSDFVSGTMILPMCLMQSSVPTVSICPSSETPLIS
jgi:hypothetical protein